MIPGYVGALMEVSLFFLSSYMVKPVFTGMDPLMYYWFCFTILTGFWEFTYLSNYYQIVEYSKILTQENKYVWFKHYGLSMILPNRFAKLFYAEYGAHADREYMSRSDFWSRLVESSHAMVCAFFCLLSMTYYYYDDSIGALVAASVAMGAQYMNSVLYMGQYFVECNDPSSVNFNSSNFPLGPYMIYRFFMWINIFWLLFPACIIIGLLKSWHVIIQQNL